jgi:dTDP-4-amino-4,6-dideoxygalactose transaminase
MIRLFQPTLGREELAAVADVFTDQWPGPGARVNEFEQAFADYIGAKRREMIAITSCTEGLFQAVAALDLSSTDEVIVPTISFIGAAHAVRAAGARLRLVDVDPSTLNPTPESIASAISSRTRAILLLHFGGRLESIKEIVAIAHKRAAVLIEDSACALGGRHNDVSYGCFGDIGIWSFDSMKLLVTGDGGMIRVSDDAIRQKIFNRVHLGGALPGRDSATIANERWWEIEPVDWGRLAFMNDLIASIGLTQLRRVDSFIQERRGIADAYDRSLAGISWIRRPPAPSHESLPYFYWIQTPPAVRNRLAVHLLDRGIYTSFRYWPLHRTKLYADNGKYPGADHASATTLLLPVHQNLSPADIAHIVDSIDSFKP